LLSTESAVSSTDVVEAATPMGSSTSDFALPIQRTPMLSVIGAAEIGWRIPLGREVIECGRKPD
jgi:hypothetical protein